MKKINKGAKIAVVSLSAGVAGESFVSHEIKLANERISRLGYKLVFMDNAMKGLQFLANNPKAKADDLLQAFRDQDVEMIICAIGGDNAYEICPYVFENQKLIEAIKKNQKVFLGFSDSTTNHLIFNKLGLNTFYGQCLLVDIAELDDKMLPYSEKHFKNLLNGFEDKKIESSAVWYEERKDFSPAALGTKRTSHKETRGYEVINKPLSTAKGILFGGCLDVIYDLLTGGRHELAKVYNDKYQIFPTDSNFYKDKILFLETSDSKPTPDEFEKQIETLLNLNVIQSSRAILFGKPQDEVYFKEYEEILRKKIKDTPILFNMNFGHALPHAILPYGRNAKVDFDNLTVEILD